MKNTLCNMNDLVIDHKEEEEEEISFSDSQSHLGGFLDGSTFSTKNDKAFDQISDAFLSLFIGGVNNE